jgi:hypothetical protein
LNATLLDAVASGTAGVLRAGCYQAVRPDSELARRHHPALTRVSPRTVGIAWHLRLLQGVVVGMVPVSYPRSSSAQGARCDVGEPSGTGQPPDPRRGDRAALRWQVALWDMWFLVWGLLLAIAVVAGWRAQRESRRLSPRREETCPSSGLLPVRRLGLRSSRGEPEPGRPGSQGGISG